MQELGVKKPVWIGPGGCRHTLWYGLREVQFRAHVISV